MSDTLILAVVVLAALVVLAVLVWGVVVVDARDIALEQLERGLEALRARVVP